jgi:hypothetical protein
MSNKWFAVVCAVITVGGVACSGNYNVNPTSNLNNSYNPKNTKPVFNWSGTAPISATINGVNWVADAGSVVYNYAGGWNEFSGSVGGKKIMSFWMNNVWAGEMFWMGSANGSQYIQYADSANESGRLVYSSFNAIQGTGAVSIITNDTGATGHLIGLFFFTGLDSNGRSIVVTNGYFNILKV